MLNTPMITSSILNLKLKFFSDPIYYSLIFFCIFLPFQFALNPAVGFDLAIVRVIIPFIFLLYVFTIINSKQSPIKQDEIAHLLVAFLLMALFSLFFSDKIFWSLRKLAFLFSIIPIYFVVAYNLNSMRKQYAAISALIFSATILAMISVTQFFAQFIFGIDTVYAFLANHITPIFLGNTFSGTILTYPSWLVNANGATYMRAVAIFPDPHMLSYYFGILIPWSVVMWQTSKKNSTLFFLSFILLVIADICTFTRGGYIALIAGSLIILPLVSKKTALKMLLASVVLVLLFLFIPHGPVTGRLASSFDVKEGSNQGRILNWKQALPIIASHPMGVGIGMYSLAIKPDADYRDPIYAHNLYLDIAAELGIIAMIIFILILFRSLTFFWIISRKQPFYIAGVASITIFAVHSLVETPLYSVHILSLICIIIGLSISAKKYA